LVKAAKAAAGNKKFGAKRDLEASERCDESGNHAAELLWLLLCFLFFGLLSFLSALLSFFFDAFMLSAMGDLFFA
jgi:hypothetical protein